MTRARSEGAKNVRRQQLLQAALDEFYERSFAGARMDDIARRAGLSKATIYLYFDSKEALFVALIESLGLPRVQQIERLLAGAQSIDQALEQLAELAPIIVRHSDMPRLMKVIVGDSQQFPDIVRDYRQKLIERILASMVQMLERAQASGEVALVDPALTTRLLVAPIVMSALWQAVFGGDAEAEVDLETLFAMHARFMLAALRPQG
jgi:AcrR family transcriptional regulator